MSKRIRIVLAEDQPLTRSTTAFLLGTHNDLEIIGEAADGQEAVDLTRFHQPDAVVLDYAMPRMNGAHAAAKILGVSPKSCVIVWSFNEKVIDAVLKAGAVAFVSKSAKIAAVADAIRQAVAKRDAGEAAE